MALASFDAQRLLPVSLRCANAFVQKHHRHHRPVQGAKFALAVTLSGSDSICGVAIVGRPVARHLDDGWTLEVTRLCTDGTPNACSKAACKLIVRSVLRVAA